MRNGPFCTMKWAVSHREMARFANEPCPDAQTSAVLPYYDRAFSAPMTCKESHFTTTHTHNHKAIISMERKHHFFNTNSDELRRKQLITRIEAALAHMSLPELEALGYDMFTKGYINDMV